MRLLHIGLHAGRNPRNGFQGSLSNAFDVLEIPDGTPSLSDVVVDRVDRFKPDLVFMQIQRDGVIDPQVVEWLSERTRVINWTGDVRKDVPEWMVDIAQWCVTSFSNMTDVKKVRAMGYESEYLQIGFDPTIFCSGDVAFRKKDVVFMGNHYKGMFPLSDFRIDAVQRLYSEFPNAFGAWGSSLPVSEGSTGYSQHLEAAIYRGARIGINISHFDYEMYSSDRMFRMMGSGVMCLSHHFKGIEDMFTVGEHLDTFKTVDEMVDKVRFYLQNPKRAAAIAMNGCIHVHKNYTYDHMVANIKNMGK
jgi:spore maturation protein CgeB